MYVITFYSYKGGTGRSMALANIAAELIKRGKRVLMIDFDLEAPGLDTYFAAIDGGSERSLGLVDLIHDYRVARAVPDISNYIHPVTLKGSVQHIDHLWLMPAGQQGDGYDGRFCALDWNKLYSEEEGFLLFEDIKRQWEQKYSPDYVLIDSRTGHTDVGGICTRQLPDCVVLMFIPNEQNLRGIKTIVDEIRDESLGDLSQHIETRFVMANIPEIDDDEDIFADASQRAKEILNYQELDGVIHHINTWHMLEQQLFVISRPKSSLAAEYRSLVEKLVRGNIEDRDGAIDYLSETFSVMRLDNYSPDAVAVENNLRTILRKHPKDSGVLRRLARVRRAQRNIRSALELYEQLLAMGERDPETLIAHAELASNFEDTQAAMRDIFEFLSFPKVPNFALEIAVKLGLRLAPSKAFEIISTPALINLDARQVLTIAELFGSERSLAKACVAYLTDWLSRAEKDIDRKEVVEGAFVLCLIASGSFAEAKRQIELVDPNKRQIANAFNYAMASWGDTGTPDPTALRHVQALAVDQAREGANFLQCLSLVNYLLDNRSEAVSLLNASFEATDEIVDEAFSCWSYLTVPVRRFWSELEEMKLAYEAGDPVPTFLRETSRALPF